MKTALALVLALGLSLFAARADAALYAASSAGGPGELYIINPVNGALISDVGPTSNVLGQNFPITGLAFNPVTGVLYGSTGNSIAGAEARLVQINPATAQVTVIGSFNAGPVNSSGTPATMSDLAFDSAGNLYGIGSIGGPQLYSINPATGQATVIGSTGLTSTSGGGLGISPSGVFNGTPTATRFGTYNSVTGAYTNIAAPTRPVGGAYAALAYNGATLYGLDLGPGPALDTHLVTIDPTTGVVTDLGQSVAALDAIAFTPIPEPATFSMLLVPAAIGLLGNRKR